MYCRRDFSLQYFSRAIYDFSQASQLLFSHQRYMRFHLYAFSHDLMTLIIIFIAFSFSFLRQHDARCRQRRCRYFPSAAAHSHSRGDANRDGATFAPMPRATRRQRDAATAARARSTPSARIFWRHTFMMRLEQRFRRCERVDSGALFHTRCCARDMAYVSGAQASVRAAKEALLSFFAARLRRPAAATITQRKLLREHGQEFSVLSKS